MSSLKKKNSVYIGSKIPGRIYNKKHGKRSEIQERPNKPFKDALREKLDGRRGF
ncbi:MAG TPA: hypothetical protein VHH33_01290 [Nitrososphaeraceae archaeon]|jgi:hypothetical protein|nr:hypothetical protein [Nitrososphaeraceae archaeon]